MTTVTDLRTDRYAEMDARVVALAGRGYQVGVAGYVEGRPVYTVRTTFAEAGAPRVLLSGGVHGDEAGGVEALLRFLESMAGDVPGPFDLTVLPCVNPWGYEAGTRGNAAGVDINRAFEEDEVPEARLVKAFLKGRRFDVHVDFHEDFEGEGFYLYEGKADTEWLGPRVIDAVVAVSPIEPEHGDDTLLYQGGYGMESAWGTKGLCVYVLAHHAPHGMTFEAAMPQPVETRVAAQLRGLGVVLDHYRCDGSKGDGQPPGQPPTAG